MSLVADSPDITLGLSVENAWALVWILSPIPGPVAEGVHNEIRAALREREQAAWV